MKSMHSNIGCLLLLAATAFAPGARAQGGPGAADSFSFRCHIRGDAGACWALEAYLRGDPTPGPLAISLVSKGVGRHEALAAAAELGEWPICPQPVDTIMGKRTSSCDPKSLVHH